MTAPRDVAAATRRALRLAAAGDAAGYRRPAAPGDRDEGVGTGRSIDLAALLAARARLRTAVHEVTVTVQDVRTDGADAAVLWTAVGGDDLGRRRVLLTDVVGMRWEGDRLVRERHRHGLLGLLGALPDDRPGTGVPEPADAGSAR